MQNSHFEFSIDPGVNCAFARHFGLLGLNSIFQRGKALREHRNYRENLNRIVDTSNCEVSLNSEDIRRITDVVASQEEERGRYRELILVDNLLSHGLARVFDSLSKIRYVEYQIYNSTDPETPFKARNWLDLPVDYVFPDFLTLS